MMLIYYKTWIYQCLIKQVKSPSICSRVPDSVRIRQKGRAGDRGVTYKTKGEKMIIYLKKVRELLRKFVLVQVRHIPRAENSRADALAKLATAS